MGATRNARGEGNSRSAPRVARREVLLAAVGLSIVVAAFWLRRMVLNEAAFGLSSADNFTYHYFADQAVSGSWKRGEVPAWNPYQLCGIPLIAALEPGAFYPPYAVHLVLPTWAAMGLSALFHLLVGALGTFALARRCGLGVLAALVGAALFGLRGTFPTYVVSPNMFGAGAWLPWGCLATIMIAERATARGVALLAAASALSFLAGHPQVTIYLLYAWTSLFVVWLLSTRPGLRGSAQRSAAFVAGVALGIAIAAVQLLPSAELTRVGTRSLEPLTPAQMAPYGAFSPAWKQLLIEPIGIDSPWSFGVVSLALTAAALLGRHRALALWALALAVVTGLFALGPITPLFGIYARLPLLGSFRAPTRLTLLTDFGFALLAATGFQAIVQGRRGSEPVRSATLVRALLPVAALAALLYYQSGSGGMPVAALAAVAFIAALRPGGPLPRLACLGLLALVAGEVAARTPLPVRFPFSPAAVERISTYDPAWAILRDQIGHDRVWVIGMAFDPAVASKQATRQHLRALDDYAPVNMRRQGEYLQFFTEGSALNRRSNVPFSGAIGTIDSPAGTPPPETRRRLLDLASVRWVVTDQTAEARPDVVRFLRAAGFRRTSLLPPPLTAYENPHALPRAFTVYRTRPAPPTPDALLAELAAPNFDPLAESIVEGDPGLAPADDSPPRGEPATFVRDDASVVELDVDMSAPGLVVLADTAYPGWEATVDGVPAPILATNHLFRGVPAPAGRHRVRFTYRSRPIAWGAGISAAGLVVLGVLAVTRRARS